MFSVHRVSDERPRHRLSLEFLENRLAPASFVVTTNADSGAGSLREAITSANALPGADRIEFAIGSGPQTIDLLTALPAVIDRVTIAGHAQPSYSGTPLIELNGDTAGTSANGLVIGPTASGTIIRGLVINRFARDGIRIFGDHCYVRGCYIGTDMAGATSLGNIKGGISIRAGASGNVIGGTIADHSNVISGNSEDGIEILGAGTSGNIIQGNYIGTNATGTAGLANLSDGIAVSGGASGNVIGGKVGGASNVISGNRSQGLSFSGPGTTGNRVQGNFIGTDASGSADLGNEDGGVLIQGGASGNVIGGTAAEVGNLISANDFTGVGIRGPGTDSNRVVGNLIGTNAAGTGELHNLFGGVSIADGARNNVIGGTTVGARNVIADGLRLHGIGTSGNLVQGNFIGTNNNGTGALGSDFGVWITAGAQGNTIGGTISGSRNVISGNDLYGVLIESTGSGTTANKVQGNFIGLDANGTGPLANGAGVGIFGEAANTLVGGTTVLARNIISANTGNGVVLAGTTGNKVKGNYIGTDKTGLVELGNGFDGVNIAGASNNVIGGTVAGSRNVISGNALGGVRISGASTNRVQGNYIGTDATGAAALGNFSIGVVIDAGASSNLLGGVTPGARNVISGNGGSGVWIEGTDTTGNRVKGNYIGIDKTGTIGLENDIGVAIFGAARSNTIGGTSAGARNVISGNAGGGVQIDGAGTKGNRVWGNFIGTNAVGDAALGNTTYGVGITGGAYSNSIGHPLAGGNVISGNDGIGVLIQDPAATGNRVQGNRIGVAASTGAALGNADFGVAILNENSHNLIGGTYVTAGNVIANNGRAGVWVQSGTGNEIRGNRIFSNAELGIDIGPSGITPNDIDDPDPGANLLQNFPELTSAELRPAGLRIKGEINSELGKQIRIWFFASPEGDASGNGEGKRVLGFVEVDTTSSTTATFNVLLSSAGVLAGHVITATATDIGFGNTSEFSETEFVV